MAGQIPDIVVLRLPLYVRALEHLAREKVELVSSQELGGHVQLTAAQIRKDLSYFGKFGKQGKGYGVAHLLLGLRRILGLDREWPMVLIGVGRLGRAILGYEGFAAQGFKIVAAFDTDPKKTGKKAGSLVVRPFDEIESYTRERRISIGIIAVPAKEAQYVVDRLVKAGVRAILNYAPIAARVPKKVKQREIDPVAELESMTYYLK
ncbi:MAG: redox-sensing transcriptional repressor Rex [Chloroflexi bacterium]|nr:redox-sensing transcriptional repressor Rex [Chloroflexota bacterium]